MVTAHLDDVQLNGLCSIVVGEEIGCGAFRKVFENLLDPTTVLKFKITSVPEDFSNVTEFLLWDSVKNFKDKRRWLAPCNAITSHGTCLTMKKTQPLSERTHNWLTKNLPRKVPRIFADVKARNWGVYQGQVVCHDYGWIFLSVSDPWRLVPSRFKIDEILGSTTE